MRFFLVLIVILFVSCSESNNSNECNPICESHLTCIDGKCFHVDISKCEAVVCDDYEACDENTGLCTGYLPDYTDTIVKARTFSSVLGSQEGIILDKYLDGVVVAIKGNPNSSEHAVILRQADQDEYAGIYVNFDKIKELDGFPTLEIGNLIELKGKLVENLGRTELHPQTIEDIIFKTTLITLPEPINVRSLDFEEKYESMVLNMTNVPFTVVKVADINYCDGDTPCISGAGCINGECEDNVYSNVLEDELGNTIKVYSDFANPVFELLIDDVLDRLSGVMTYENGEFNLYPRNLEDINITKVK